MDVRPFELRAAARVLTRDASGVQQGLHRLRLASEAVPLNPGDPGLDWDLTARRLGALAGLQRSAAALLSIAGELESAASAALAADRTAGRWGLPGVADDGALICRLPDGVHQSLDRGLTDLVGDGLSAAVAEAVAAVDWILPSNGRGVSGDRGGRFSTRRVPFAVPGAGPVAASKSTSGRRGRGAPSPGIRSSAGGLVAAALDTTADETVLARDEFGLVDHGRDRYTVVLPGVADLSRPQPGWNPVHRSPRDFDMAAVRSSRSSGIDDNLYARSVAEALVAVGVPDGAELVIVGHSFGADTALDLAADPDFAGRHRVTHVVATGYYSQPQLTSVAAGTRVLVVQNRRDLVVNLGSAMPTTETGVLACGSTVSASGDRTAVVRFDGGLGGFGHSINVYRTVFTGGANLDSADAAVVDGFLASIDRPPEPPGTMLAIDISLPETRPSQRT